MFVSCKRIMLMVKRTCMLTFRGPDPLIDFFYWPLYDIMLWGFASSWIVAESNNSSLSLTILSSLVLWQAVYRANLDISYTFLMEMWSSNLINLFVSPLTHKDWMIAAMITGVINACIAIFFGTMAVWFLYGLWIPSLGLIFPLLAASLFFSGWAIGLFTSSLLVALGAGAQKCVWVMGWAFVPFVGIFYPVESMPLWAQSVAVCLPMTYIFKVLRIFIETGVFDKGMFFFSCVLHLIYLALAVSLFMYCFKSSCVRGLARLEKSE